MHFINPVEVAGWPEPNYDDPATRGHGMIAVMVLLVVAVTVFGMRCFSRLRISGGLGLDDVLLAVALLPAIGLYAAVMTAYQKYAWGNHVWDTRREQFRPGLQVAFASWILFALTSALTKLSLLAFYVRLVPRNSRVYRWCLYTAMGVVAMLGLNNVFEVIFMCKPIYAFWDFVPPRYHPTYQFHCNNRGLTFLQSSLNNSIVNVALLLIPIPLIWTRRAFSRGQRLPLSILFTLGTTVCVISALQTAFIVDAYVKSLDQQWAAYPLWVTMLVEVDLSLIVVSATAIGPLLARWLPKYFDAIAYEQPSDPSVVDEKPKPSSGSFNHAFRALTGRSRSNRPRRPSRGFVPLESDFQAPLPKSSTTNFNAETSYSAGGQITDPEKGNARYSVTPISATFPKDAIKSTGERGVKKEKMGLRVAFVDGDDEAGQVRILKSQGKFREVDDGGELARWSNIGEAK